MTYVLVLWTVIACVPAQCKSDWKPLGEFYTSHQDANNSRSPVVTAQQRCEEAAKTLAIKADQYRCVRTK